MFSLPLLGEGAVTVQKLALDAGWQAGGKGDDTAAHEQNAAAPTAAAQTGRRARIQAGAPGGPGPPLAENSGSCQQRTRTAQTWHAQHACCQKCVLIRGYSNGGARCQCQRQNTKGGQADLRPTARDGLGPCRSCLDGQKEVH